MTHRRVRVTEADLLSADTEYSRVATGALFVESSEEVEEVVYGFVGSDSVLTFESICARLREAGIVDNDCAAVVEELLQATFIGMEVADGEFAFAEDPRDLRRFKAMAKALAARRGVPSRYKIHPAYHPFLGLNDFQNPQLALT